MAQPQIRQAASEGAQILRVVDITEDELIVTAHSGPAEPWRVRSALPPNVRVGPGDEVVVLASSEGPVAIARLRDPNVNTQALSDGTRVHSDDSSIAVERADGTPLFRYSVESGRGSVTLSAETLNLAASTGDLCLSAAGEIRLRSRSLSLQSGMPGARSGLELTPRSARLSGDAVAVSGRAFRLDAAEAELRGGELRTQFKRAVVVLERLETTADSVVSRARNVYQSVQELLQQQAGSLRTLVAGSAQLKARDIAQRAEEAYKIRADKIHLG
jgi:Protein of unknown function (DUF3540)